MEKSNVSNNNEQAKKRNPGQMREELLNQYVRENRSPKNIRKITKLKEIDKDILDGLAKIKQSNIDKYGDVELNNINTGDGIDIHALKRVYSKDIFKLNAAESNFLSSVKKTFIVPTNQEQNVLNLLEDKTADGIYSLINSPARLQELIDGSDLSLDVVDFNKSLKEIEALNDSDIQLLKKGLKSEQKVEVDLIISRIKTKTYTDSDIRGLMEYKILPIETRKRIVEVYIPTITLQQAKDYGFFDAVSVEVKKKEILTKSIRAFFEPEDILGGIESEIINNASLSDITIDTKDLYNSDSDFENVLKTLSKKVGFKNLENDLVLSVDQAKEEIKKNGPQNLEELVYSLSEVKTRNKFKNLEKLKVGNIFSISSINPHNKESTIVNYFKIESIDDENKGFNYSGVGEGNKISLKSNPEETNLYTFSAFLESFTTQNKDGYDFNLDCFSIEDINKKVDSGELTTYEFEEKNLENMNPKDREELKIKNIDELTVEIRELEYDIVHLEDGKEKRQKELLLAQKNNRLENTSDSELINQRLFIDKLDEIDPKGNKFGFGKGVFFELKDGLVFEVDGFGDDITLRFTRSGEIQSNISFSEFIDVFRKQNGKRVEKIDSGESLIEKRKSKNSNWDNFEIENGEFVQDVKSEGKNKGKKTADFLVGDKTNEIIKINNISGNIVTIQFGERKDFEDLTKKEKKDSKIDKDDKGEKLYLDDREFNITLNDLDLLIDKDDLYPNYETGKTIEPEPISDYQNDFHGSFLSRFFKRKSIKELLAGGKMLLDGIEEILKKGNDINAADFAETLGKLLPGDLAEEMQTKVERAQLEQQDKELESLGKVDSWIAVERIEKWLKNRDTPEYKKEAGILFMLEGYGHLTSKKALYAYRGKRLWYEALGGRIGDKLFNEVKNSAKESDITFSEEFLVHILLKQQCSGRLPPKRRSRLHKEYEHKWKSGVKDEFEKGYGDAEKKRTAKDINNGGHGEADTGTTSNAIGWYKKCVERGGSLEEMSEGFFALLFSGSLYNIDQATFLQIKNLWDADGMPIIMTRFSTTKSDMVDFNNTIVNLSKRIEKAYPQHKGMYEKAKNLFDGAINSKGKESDRFTECVDFWKEHGKPLAGALNGKNTESNEYSLTDKVVFLEKDNDEVLNTYYKKSRAFTGMENSFGKGFMDEDCGEAGVTGLNVFQLTKKYMGLGNNRKFYNEFTGGRVWKEISNDILATKNKTFHDGTNEEDKKKNREKQEKYLFFVLQELIAGFVEKMGGTTLSGYNDPSSEVGQCFNAWGLNIEKDMGRFSASQILKGEDPDIKRLLLRTAGNILDSKNSGVIEGVNLMDMLTNSTKTNTNNVIKKRTASDDYGQENAA